jgi:hypothetical protein
MDDENLTSNFEIWQLNDRPRKDAYRALKAYERAKRVDHVPYTGMGRRQSRKKTHFVFIRITEVIRDVFNYASRFSFSNRASILPSRT